MNSFTEPWYPEDDSLEHYGVKGMKWGVRKESEQKESSKKRINKKALTAAGAIIATSLAVYGGYRYGSFIKKRNVELAIEKGKKFAEQMKKSDIVASEKYPDVFTVKSNEHYEKFVKEYADEARAQKFREAYKNVKTSDAASKKVLEAQKRSLKSAKRTIKELRSGKLGFGTISSFNFLQKHNPELLKDLGISVVDGHIYEHGKKIY